MTESNKGKQMSRFRSVPDAVVFVETLEVCSWSPGSVDEEVPATQVHIVLGVPSFGSHLVMRLTSIEATNCLISALIEHRDHVWNNPQDQKGHK